MDTRCPRCDGRLFRSFAEDEVSCLACGWCGETRPAVPVPGRREERLRGRSLASLDAVKSQVVRLLAGGGQYTVAQMAQSLHIDRRRIDSLMPSLLDGEIEVCGTAGRARLFRKVNG